MSCSEDSGRIQKHIRFVENALVATEGSEITFKNGTFDLSDWFFSSDDHWSAAYDLSQDENVIVDIKGEWSFISLRVIWPDSTSLEDKFLEVFLPDMGFLANTSVPSVTTDDTAYFKMALRSFFTMDSPIKNDPVEINNISPEKAQVGVFLSK